MRRALGELLARVELRRRRVNALRSMAVLPDPALSAADLAGVRTAVPATTPRARNTPRRRSGDSAYSEGLSWPPGGCSDVIPGATGDLIPSRTSGCSSPEHRPRPPDHVCLSEHLPAADRRLRGGPPVLPQPRRALVGPVDRGADDPDAGDPAPADRQAVPLDAEAAAHAAADEGHPGEVQGRQAAPAAGDHEVLQGERDQPARLLPAAGRADPGLHLALLHAAPGPAEEHLPARPRRPTSSSTPRPTTSRSPRPPATQPRAGPTTAPASCSSPT